MFNAAKKHESAGLKMEHSNNNILLINADKQFIHFGYT